jgi:hypothetical protein
MTEVSDAVELNVEAAAAAGVDAEVNEPWSGMLKLVDELEAPVEETIEREDAGSRAGSPEILYIDNLEDPPHFEAVSGYLGTIRERDV